MKIVAVSDIHGHLINIKDRCDVFVIAGDWSPLYIQCDYSAVMNWIRNQFIPWLMNIDASHIVFIAGNHDLACAYTTFVRDLNKLLKNLNLQDKIHYINRSSVTIDNKKFYGLPDTEGLRGWAFSKISNVDYSFDKDTSILITHQPPKIGNIGFVVQYNREFGSADLYNKILKSNVELNICGHIHTGDHKPYQVRKDNGYLVKLQNVSVLDEEYNVAFNPTIIEL